MRFKFIAIIFLGLLTACWFYQVRESEEAASLSGPPVPAPPSKGDSSYASPSMEPLVENRESSLALRFHRDNGELIAYRIELSARAQIDMGQLLPAGGPSPTRTDSRESVRTSGRGELRLKFYSHDAETWNVAGLFAALDYRINVETPYWLDAAGYPFTFRMNSQGVIDHFEFTKGIPEVAQEFTRDILTSMQVVLPETAKGSWETRETDTTGRYRALYSVLSADREARRVELHKRKAEYISTRMAQNPLNTRLASSRPRLDRAEALIDLPLEGGWLQRIHYEEVSSIVSDGKAWSAGERSFAAEKIPFRGEGDFPETYALFQARLQSAAYLEAADYQTDPTLDRLGAGLTMEEAIDVFRRLSASDSAEERRLAEKFLVNYLRQHPAASFDLVYILDSSTKEQIDTSTQLILWRLLTEAGHREAQQALGQAASGGGFSNLSHWRAVSYAHDFARPEAELIADLWKVRRAPVQPDPELQEMALYALGTLGGKEDIDEDLARQLRQQLSAELIASTSLQDQAVALAAIGNTGASAMIDAITPYLASPDGGIRAAALEAMRRMNDPIASEILIGHYQRESSPAVREVAARTLARLPADAASVRWASQEVLLARDPEAQVAMVGLLGESLKEYPANEKTLRQLLDANPSRQVKKEIYRFIEPR